MRGSRGVLPFLKLSLVMGVALSVLGCDNGAPKRGDVNYGVGSVNLDDVVSYRSDSPYRDVLKRCVTVQFTYQSCTLETLPLLGQLSSDPTIDEIMDRVVVSHQWMGDNFLLALGSLPADMRLLLRSVTAIVIDADIQPAFYDPTSGAIYLDPSLLWLTVAQKQTLPARADFRDDYGRDLQFVDLWRYVKQNDYAWPYFDLADERERTLADIRLAFARLLYHELAHANDFVPVDQIALLDASHTIYQAISAIHSQRGSSRLIQNLPLYSTALTQIAQVRFAGQTATDTQRGYTPGYIGTLFQYDGANMLYSYTSQYEDFALLFEETIMKYHFGVELDVAFSYNLRGDQLRCDDYLVAWGQRNRIATAWVKPRAQWVAAQLLPSIDWGTFFSLDVGSTIQMGNGGWCENLVQGTASTASTRMRRALDADGEVLMPQQDLRPPH